MNTIFAVDYRISLNTCWQLKRVSTSELFIQSINSVQQTIDSCDFSIRMEVQFIIMVIWHKAKICYAQLIEWVDFCHVIDAFYCWICNRWILSKTIIISSTPKMVSSHRHNGYILLRCQLFNQMREMERVSERDADK